MKYIDYERNPALLLIVYWYVMIVKVFKCLFVKDYQPKRIYF